MAAPQRTDDALAQLRHARRCRGGSGCGCVSDSSSRSGSPARNGASPSRSRSASADGANSGGSSLPQGSSDGTKSGSGTSIPNAEYEHNWSGMSVVRIPKCAHARHAVMKQVWGGKHTGRRFLGCPIEDEMNQCQFVEWMDEPWPAHVQESLKKMWKEVKTMRRCEEKANEALIEAIVYNEKANEARIALREEVTRTKRFAQRACYCYQRKAAVAVIDKCKLMYLIYCLLGVLVFLLVSIFFKMK